MSAPRLYHFTCDHGHKGIQASGSLIDPQIAHPICGWRVSWFTTLAEPDRETTGLAALITSCDRMAHRYVIEPGSSARAWLFSAERMRTPPDFLFTLESYGDPEHWWISDTPVPALLDRTWERAA